MAEEDNLALSVVCERSPGTAVEAASGRPPKAGSERARRQTMSRLYDELGALLPTSPRVSSPCSLAKVLARSGSRRVTSSPGKINRCVWCAGVDDADRGGGHRVRGELRARTAELEAYSAVAAAAGRAARDGPAEVVASGKTSCFAVRLRAARAGRGADARARGVPAPRRGRPRGHRGARRRETAVTVTTAAVAPRVLETIKAEIICAA